MITQSLPNTISFCVPQSELARARQVLEEEFYLELKDGLLDPLDILKTGGDFSGGRWHAHAARHFSQIFLALARAIQYRGDCSGILASISVVVNNDEVSTGFAWCIRCCSPPIGNRSVCGRVGGVAARAGSVTSPAVVAKKKHIDLRVCGIANPVRCNPRPRHAI